MPPSDANTERMELMVKYGLTACEWDDNGLIRHARRDPLPLSKPAAAPTGERPVADLAKRIAEQREARHRIMFAASGTKPAVEHPQPPQSVVPRAVRAKQDARGAK